MATDRIDIQVTDGGADKAAANIRSIGTAADKADTAVSRLKANLASVNTTAVGKLSSELEKNSASTAKLTAAQTRQETAAARLATAQANQAAAMARAELAASKLSAANAKASLSTDKVAASAVKATASLDAEAAAQARIAAMVAKTANVPVPQAALGAGNRLPLAQGVSAAQLSAEAAQATAAVRQVEAASEDLAVKAPGIFARFKVAALSGFDALRDFATGNGTRFRSEVGAVAAGVEELGLKAAASTPHVKTNSTAIRELLVIAREGGRGDFNRMAGSVSILANALGLLRIALPIAIAGIVAMGAAKFALNTETEQKSLKAYAESLGLTEKEMRKLSNTTVDASGKIREHNVLQVTFGDVFNGVIQTMEDGISKIASAWDLTTDKTRNSTMTVLQFVGQFVANLVGGIYAFAKFLYTTVSNLFTAAQNLGTLVGNAIFVTFETVANGIRGIFNSIVGVINFASNAVGKGDIVKPIAMVNVGVGNLTKGLKSLKSEDFFGDMRKGAAATNGVIADIGKNITNASRARIKAAADAIKANRNPGAAKKPGAASDPKTQADYLVDNNKKLDDELSRMQMLKDAREVQQRLDQIEESFIQRRMPLDEKQIALFRQKIQAIQDYKYVQAESDRIMEEAEGPVRKMNSAIAAATQLYDRHLISQERLDAELYKATQAYKEATDPLFKFNQAIDSATRLVGKYGVELERATYLESVRQEYDRRGLSMYDQTTGKLKAEVAQLVAKNDALRQQQQIQSTVGSVLNPILDKQREVAGEQSFYDALKRLRDADLIDDDAYTRAKLALHTKLNEDKLNATSSFFGALAAATKNGHGVIGAISKAAAVAEATIQGFVAVQKALASAPPPFNFIAAAAVAIATGTQVAGILSTNAGSFATGGQFMVAGRSGVDANNINMNVTKGERVTIETAAQQRANDNQKGGTPHVDARVKVVNNFDEATFLAAMDSDHGERLILNVIRRNADGIASVVNGK